MYDFDRLEKRCKLYHLKKNIFILIAFLVFVATVMASLMFFNNEESLPKSKSSVAEKYVAKEKIKISRVIPTTINNIKESKVKQSIQKTVDFLPLTKKIKSSMCYSLQFFVAKDIGIKYLHSKERKLKKLGFDCSIHKGRSLLHLLCGETKDYDEFLKSKELARQYNLDYVTKKVLCSQKPYKHIKVKKTEKIVVEIKPTIKKEDTFILQSQKFNPTYFKKLFQERQSYDIALKLAKYYYRTGDYTNAIEWAKKANGIDKTDAESWIIYAKSLYNLGDKEKAKKILHIYLQFENSKQINKILSKWSNA